MKDFNDKEKEYLHEKKWMYQGEASAYDRPTNSLLNLDIDYRQTQTVTKQSKLEEDEIKSLVKSRIREKKFDNFVFVTSKPDDEEEEFKVECDTVLSPEEIKELLGELTKELLQIGDMNRFITSPKNTETKSEVQKKVKKRKINISTQLKKQKNVEFI